MSSTKARDDLHRKSIEGLCTALSLVSLDGSHRDLQSSKRRTYRHEPLIGRISSFAFVPVRISRIEDHRSVYSHRRTHFTTALQADKANRDGSMDHEHYYLVPKVPSDAGSDRKKRSRSLVRPTVRSTTANSQNTTIDKQPAQVERGKSSRRLRSSPSVVFASSRSTCRDVHQSFLDQCLQASARGDSLPLQRRRGDSHAQRIVASKSQTRTVRRIEKDHRMRTFPADLVRRRTSH